MSNIYLQLPTPICHFHRNRDKTKLSPFEPVKLSKLDEKSVILRGSLAFFREMGRSKSYPCYSQQQWKNILLGKTPNGSKQILQRDPTIWPTYDEICKIEGTQLNFRSDSYDYLCIQIPQTIFIGTRQVRTNPSYTLDKSDAYDLQILFTLDFKRALVNFELETQARCIQDDYIIKRGQMNTLERFLMEYDIPIAQDGREKDYIRRQLDRWLDKAKVYEKAYRTFSIDYIDSQDIIVKRSRNY